MSNFIIPPLEFKDSARRMWAGRLPEKHHKMLEECVKASPGANQTKIVCRLIENYYEAYVKGRLDKPAASPIPLPNPAPAPSSPALVSAAGRRKRKFSMTVQGDTSALMKVMNNQVLSELEEEAMLEKQNLTGGR